MPEILGTDLKRLVPGMEPFWLMPGEPRNRVELFHGNSLQVLHRMPSSSVHCVCTSPPYWGQRNYGNGTDELGSEPTYQGFVNSIVDLGQAIHHVLRDDGVWWLNLGDGYAKPGCGLKNGSLLGVPWRAALALQDSGWSLRADVPWVKRSAMPESAEQRPNKSLEYIFMLTKGSHYYFDMQAVRGTRNFRNSDLWFESADAPHGVTGIGDDIVGMDVTNSGYKGKHFAVYPQRLITPLLLSSTSMYGACSDCGCPWWRVTSRDVAGRADEDSRGDRDRSIASNRNGITGSLDGVIAKRETVGWLAGCRCGADVVPCVVLDPFNGSGTTALTALELGLSAVGVDLSAEYLANEAIPRIMQYMPSVSEPIESELMLAAPLPAVFFEGE